MLLLLQVLRGGGGRREGRVSTKESEDQGDGCSIAKMQCSMGMIPEKGVELRQSLEKLLLDYHFSTYMQTHPSTLAQSTLHKGRQGSEFEPVTDFRVINCH